MMLKLLEKLRWTVLAAKYTAGVFTASAMLNMLLPLVLGSVPQVFVWVFVLSLLAAQILVPLGVIVWLGLKLMNRAERPQTATQPQTATLGMGVALPGWDRIKDALHLIVSCGFLFAQMAIVVAGIWATIASSGGTSIDDKVWRMIASIASAAIALHLLSLLQDRIGIDNLLVVDTKALFWIGFIILLCGPLGGVIWVIVLTVQFVEADGIGWLFLTGPFAFGIATAIGVTAGAIVIAASQASVRMNGAMARN